MKLSALVFVKSVPNVSFLKGKWRVEGISYAFFSEKPPLVDKGWGSS